MKMMDMTASQAQVLTAPYAGEITAQQVLDIPVSFGAGADAASFTDILRDVRQRGDGVVIVNMASDDKDAPVSAFLAQTQPEKLKAAFAAVLEASGASEAYLVKTKDIDLELDGAKSVVTDRSLVLREESALCHIIKTGELRSAPLEKEFISEGMDGRPTLIADAQTLVRVYAAAGDNYRETRLMMVRVPGAMQFAEFLTGTPLSKVVEECGQKAEKSILLGGLSGLFVDKGDLDSFKVDLSGKWDFVGVYGAKDCMASLTASLADRAREETCQKCVLCREGTWHFSNIFGQVAAGKAKKEDLAMVGDIGPLIHIGAFCSFGQQMAQLFVSSVETNRDELEAHFIRKKCPAGVCAAFSKPVIDPSKCTGCTDCLYVCDEDAITGKKKFIHMIDPDMCENCGKCAEACEEGAIVPQDGTIRVPKKLVRVGKF